MLVMIQTAAPIHVCSQDKYHRIDRVVTGHAFAIHNELGRFLDERLYQRELTARCRNDGLAVHPEMEIAVTHRDFTKRYLVDLLDDWGAFLDPHLYREALTHFPGGAEKVIQPIDVTTANGMIGKHEMHLLSPTSAFALTAVTRRPSAMAEHQRRFLRHTSLAAIAWVNFNRHDIELRTITG